MRNPRSGRENAQRTVKYVANAANHTILKTHVTARTNNPGSNCSPSHTLLAKWREPSPPPSALRQAAPRITGAAAIQLDHHLYNNLSKRWIQHAYSFCRSWSHCHCSPGQLHRLGIWTHHFTPQSTWHSAMVNTNCQSCLASVKLILNLGLSEKDIIPENVENKWRQDSCYCNHRIS